MRWKFSLLAVFSVVLLSGCVTRAIYDYKNERDDQARYQADVKSGKITPVAIRVVDQDGKPVPYAEVWRMELPAPAKPFLPWELPVLDVGYLDRASQRYRDMPELASLDQRWGRSALLSEASSRGAVQALRMGGPDGTTADKIGTVDVGDPLPRAELIHVKYAALRYGYIPGEVQFDVRKGEQVPLQTIVMRRDPGIVIPDAPYVREYEQLLLDAQSKPSDTEAFRQALLKAGQEAEAAGDKTFAARIYALVPTLQIKVPFDRSDAKFKITGYEREKEDSERNRALVKKALGLDPHNHYLAMKALVFDPPHDKAVLAQQLEGLVKDGRDDLWPDLFLRLEDAYYQAGQMDRAYYWHKYAAAREPDDAENAPYLLKRHLARYVDLETFKRDFVTGSDVNAQDEYHTIPLDYALAAGRIDALEWLLKNGVKRPYGVPLLIGAVSSGRLEMVKYVVTLPMSVSGIADQQVAAELAALDIPDRRSRIGWDDDYIAGLRKIYQERLDAATPAQATSSKH